MTTHQARVIDYFDQTASDYRWLWGANRHLGLHCGYADRQHRGHDNAVLNMNRVLATTARITATDRVLDAGCGIGGSSLWLAEHRGAEAVGVNINAGQVLAAKEALRRKRLGSRVQFYVADFAATGLAAASFDVVWALESMCYAESKPAFLAESWRLLKPGGRLVVADGFLARDELTPDESRLVERWCAGWAIPNVASAHQFAAWLCEANFSAVRMNDVTEHVRPSARRIYRASLLLKPLCAALERCGLRSEVQTRGIDAGYCQYAALRRGLGLYGIFYAEKPGDVSAPRA